jgi:hypothetical protein
MTMAGIVAGTSTTMTMTMTDASLWRARSSSSYRGSDSAAISFSEYSVAKNDFMHIRGVDPLKRLAFDKLHERRWTAADYM